MGLDGTSLEWCESLPNDPQEVYDIFGHFWDDVRHRYAPRLARYQLEVWDDMMSNKYCVYLKGQKLGFTTFMHMMTIWKALTTDRGNSMYIVSQDLNIAVMHLNALKTYMRNSPALAPYLIERPPVDELGRILKAGASKVRVAMIANPEDPNRPTEIHAKSITADANLISHAHVSHIHMSDISAARMTEGEMEESLGKVMTRLLNTSGSMVVESPPSLHAHNVMTRIGFGVLDEVRRRDGMGALGPDREFHRDGRAYQGELWRLRRLPTEDIGIRDGVVTQKTVDKMKKGMLSVVYERLCEASLHTGENRAFDRGMSDQVDEGPTTDIVNSWIQEGGNREGPAW